MENIGAVLLMKSLFTIKRFRRQRIVGHYNSGVGTSLIVSGLKFQLAAKAPGFRWLDSDFVGPDGTTAIYFTASGTDIPSTSFDTKRYIKYKAYLSTADASYTPALNDVSITFSDNNARTGRFSDVSGQSRYHYRGRGIKSSTAVNPVSRYAGAWGMWMSPLSLPILCPETERFVITFPTGFVLNSGAATARLHHLRWIGAWA